MKLSTGFVVAPVVALFAVACREDDVLSPRNQPAPPPPSFVISPGSGDECFFAQVDASSGIGFSQPADAGSSCNTSGSIRPSTPIYFNPTVAGGWFSTDENDLMGAQSEPVTFKFHQPILNPVVVGGGTLQCGGDGGEVVAYTVSGAILRAPIGITGSCSPANSACCIESTPIISTQLIDSILLVPPAPTQWVYIHHDLICGNNAPDDCVPNDWPEDVFVKVGYTVYFREPPATNLTVSVIRAAGQNEGGSFTSVFGENTLTLEATVNPPQESPHTTWEIVDNSEDRVPTIPPTTTDPETGTLVEAILPLQNSGRWASVTHADDLKHKSLSVWVTAVVQTSQGAVRSNTVTITQDEIDTMREEYQELGKLHLPARTTIRSAASNKGDYTVAVVNEDFDTRLQTLHDAWIAMGLAWAISSYFRNPVHNDYHIDPRGAQESRHQYGCAADITTTPLSTPPTNSELDNAKAFAKQLAKLARRQSFWVFPLEKQPLPDHVHVQSTCF